MRFYRIREQKGTLLCNPKTRTTINEQERENYDAHHARGPPVQKRTSQLCITIVESYESSKTKRRKNS